MTDSQPPLSDDELLSAYLDGALAGDELSRAERLLTERPGSRQLLEELRALGNGLRDLPRSGLGNAFPERVMRKAERELLSGSPAPAVLPADALRSRLRNKRPWIYVAITMAAGLLVAVFSWPHEPGGKASMKLAEAPAREAGRGTSGESIAYDSAQAHDRFARKLAASDRKPTRPLKSAAADKAAAGKAGAGKAAKDNAVKDDAAKDDAPLKESLERLGLVQLNDEIVRQVIAAELVPPMAAGQPLSVWSCTVSRDALEQDVLGRVLLRNSVQLQDEQLLDAAGGRAVDAVNQNNAATELVDVVLVTATPGQLGAALADLRSQSATFRNLKHFGPHGPSPSLSATLPAAPAIGAPGAAAPPAAKARQAEPTGGSQQAAGAGNLAGRAVRLRLSNQAGAAQHPLPPVAAASPATGNENQKLGGQRDGEQTAEKRRGAKHEQAVELERALFILRSTEPPAAPPGAPPAKEAQ
jgi:hypothetical protein